jgi:molecular chaperone Hsp33
MIKNCEKTMLNSTRLYSFLDQNKGFAVYFLEGQQLIQDMAVRQNLSQDAFHYNRNTLLTSLHILNYLKASENIGYYIDSEKPYFRYKMEANFNGHYRTLLIPLDFNSFPEKISGMVRLSKFIANSSTPYNSIVKVTQEPTSNLINRILEDSYQVKSKIFISDDADQSIMVQKLPPEQVDKEVVIETQSLEDYITKNHSHFNAIMQAGLNETTEIVSRFEKMGYIYLSSKQLNFHCPCSKEQMMVHIANLEEQDMEHVFEKNVIEIKCDYCNSKYQITKDEINELIERGLQ